MQLAPITIENLFETVERILSKSGLVEAQAAAFAKVIASAERDACKSHGIYRIEGALRTIKSGKVNADALPTLSPPDGSGIIRVSANGGFSSAAFDAGLPSLVARTKELGVAALVLNECTHLTALWYEVEALTREGLAAIVMCPNYATVAPAGGQKAVLGTNPFAFGWPRPNAEPYVFDFATSVAARGEIELYRRNKTPLPPGWALDAEGRPTTDPEAALQGAMLPFGGHKGSAISTMVELLAGSMIGDWTSLEGLKFLKDTSLAPQHGELVIAMSPELFSKGRAGNPFQSAEALFDAILNQGARLPSQRRFAARKRSEEHGIPLTAAELAQLERFLSNGLDAV